MLTHELLLVAGAVLAMIASGAIGSIESALSTISLAQVEEFAHDGAPGARSLLKVVRRRSDHINLLVLLRTFLESAAAVLAAVLALALLGSESTAVIAAIIAVTFVSYAVVGVLSRTVGRKNPYTVALKSAQILSVLAFVLGPISKILIWFGNKLTPGSSLKAGPYSTEVALKEMVDQAMRAGVVESDERRMIQSVFDLADTTARSVMVPRTDMIWIEKDATAGQATNLCVRSGHSRIPVVGDNVDDIVGVVYLKDLVQRTYNATDGGTSVAVADVMRSASFVPDSVSLDDLLENMQVNRNHIAMLVDEYGGIAGLISIEDILEEIVGEIADEYDQEEIQPVERLAPRRFRVVARLTLEDLVDLIADELGQKIEFEDDIVDEVETVAGLISYEIGKVPLPDTTVTVGDVTLTSEGGRDRRGRLRVTSVIVDVAPHSHGDGDDDAE